MEKTLAGDCCGMAVLAALSLPPVLSARGGELVPAVLIIGDEPVLPHVQRRDEVEGAVQLQEEVLASYRCGVAVPAIRDGQAPCNIP